MPLIVDHAERRISYARAAWDVIAAHGLVGTTMRDLAAAADVTTGAITHYFGSKQQLVEQALEVLASDTLERTAEVEIATRNDLADLVLLALPTDEIGRTEWKTWIALWSECARGNATAVALNAGFDERWLKVLTDALVTLGHGTPGQAAQQLAMTINGAGIEATLNPERWPAGRLAELAATLAQSV